MHTRYIKTLGVALIVAMLITAVAPGAMAHVDAGDATAPTGPQLWQVKEPPAYVPAARDGEIWRSVRMPPAFMVKELLKEEGRLPLDASDEALEQAVAGWYQQARKDAYIGPDPLAYRKLKAREQAMLSGEAATDDWTLPTPPKDVLAVVVEFGGSDTIVRPYPNPDDPAGPCVDTEFTFEPLALGQDPPPGPRDNFTFFKPDISVADYQEIFFGEGPEAGYGLFQHPTLGEIDLRGYTLQNYLLEMSGGTYRAGGAVLAEAVTVPHAHEYYGYARYANNDDGACQLTSIFSDANYFQYVPDVIDAIAAQYGDSIDWSQYDADEDRIIDLLVTIHAGYGFQNGGGYDRLSTSSASFFPNQIQIGGFSTPDDPNDDYFVQGFNVDPEQLDLGAVQEEFEHQFGMPDLYSVDQDNSNSWWGAHSNGVWGGPLGGTRPVGHNLWQDWILGWRDPVVIDYDDPALEITLGQARYTPEGAEDGLIINLPSQETVIDNLAGEGVGWYSNSGDALDHRVYRDFDLGAASGQIIFAFDAYWNIEDDWDYGFFEVSTDGGETWETLPDMDGVLTDSDPNGNNLGWGLTAAGEGRLRFDLSAYAGLTIGLRLRYLTDTAVALPGWWVDNLSLDDDNGNLYANDLETDFSDWTVEGWVVTPFQNIDERFYLVEWRNDNGFDQSLNNPYHPVWVPPEEPPPDFEVDRLPATTPGMIISYRDTSQEFDYEIAGNLFDSPSIGPKFGLLVVDSHYFPQQFDTHFDGFRGGWLGAFPSNRVLPGDAAFGLTPTREWTARLGRDLDTGEYVETPLETKTWLGQPPVAAFHDSWGYYPGVFYPGVGDLIFLTHWGASAVVPTKGDYTTRITGLDFTPLPALYGGGFGSGNPGDDQVQYGVHLAVLEQSDEMATVRFWNSLFEFEGSLTQTANTDPVVHGSTVDVAVSATNIGGMVDGFFLLPIDPDAEYVMGSAYGGATPLTAAYAAQLAAQRGIENLASLAAARAPDEVVAVAFMGMVATGESVDFGFSVRVTSASGQIQHSAAMFDGSRFFQSLESGLIDVTDNSAYPVERSQRFDVLEDAFIHGLRPTTNFGASETMWVGFVDMMRPAVYAPISDIPTDAAIDVAYLYLFVVEGRGFSDWSSSVINVYAHALMTDWSESAVTWWTPWAMAGGDFGETVGTNHLGSGKVGTWLRLDVTDAVEHSVRSGENYGFLLTSDDENGVRYGLATTEHWNSAWQGYLRVMYRTAE